MGGGVDGYAHSLFWHLPLSKAEVQLLRITGWKFVALAFNVIIFGSRANGHAVALFADALSTVQVLLRQRALSPVLQIIHALLVNLPEFRALGIDVPFDHAYCRINVLGDVASRGLLTSSIASLEILASQPTKSWCRNER